ncbi:MAG: glutamine synthetase family protein [Thermodesulfobacteriota bacterium]
MKNLEQVRAEIREQEIELIRFVYIDNDGVVRGYAVTPEVFEGDLAAGHSYAEVMPFFSVMDDLVPGSIFGCTGEISGVPDLNTFRILPHAPHSAMMICDFRRSSDHSPTGLCARTLLKEYLAGLEYEAKAAFENEFYLVVKDEDGTYRPFDRSVCFATAGMNLQHEVVLDIVRNLKAQGLVIEKYYPEYGKGQVEIVYKYGAALDTADNQVLFRETVKGTAARHGVIATFMPKPFQDLAGSGAHLHLSLFQDGRNLLYDPQAPDQLSQAGRHFLGGLRQHLPALCAFTASTVNSYKRLVPHHWASAYNCWGLQNREAALRVVSGLRGREEASFNIEIKPVDPACHPHLVVLAALAAGMDGLRNELDPGEPVLVDPYTLTGEEREKMGIHRLPVTLDQALTALENDPFYRDLLGRVFYDEYLKMKRFAWTRYIEHVSDWEKALYLEVF